MYKVLEVSPKAKCLLGISTMPGINSHRRVFITDRRLGTITQTYFYKKKSGGARSVMVILAGNGHSDTSPGRD